MSAPPWRLDGRLLVREWRFRDFETALHFIEQVSQEAIDYKRRPDMCIDDYNHGGSRSATCTTPI